MNSDNKEHCCPKMAGYIDPECEQHPDPKECEDALVNYDQRFDQYSLLARFGSPWMTVIQFCPWCGDRKRDLSEQYYDQLDVLGVDYPDDEPPSEFKTDRWWRERNL